ncbi:MAG TPA: hypothetical protein VGO00_04230 [Kofleriaceae bacterium]|nr:hypothetical protein [Kofleriaceae bacterium]
MSLAACSGSSSTGDTPRQACEDLNAAVCERLYACLTPAELTTAGFPAAEAACVTMTQSQAGCAAQTDQNVCDGNQTYHPDEASQCIDQISGLTCADIRSDTDLSGQAPACAKACSV